jgi:3'-5' exoribonuclease
MMEENRENLLTFPAAEKLHHAMRGGLLYHTLSIVRLAESVCTIYPCIDRELLLSGAILHDIAKIREYSVNSTSNVDGHTLEGMLLGHLVMGAEDVGRMCDSLGVPSEKKYLLQHMLISHHGKLEFGAAVRPSFIEAEVLSQLDLFDANMYEMAEAVGGVKAGEFTGRLWMLDNRKLYNHGRIDVSPVANITEE